MINKELLEILACPQCKDKLHLDSKNESLICKRCHLQFEIKKGIPNMVACEAERYSPEETR
jgi:uncharacterized protein YbaR (Trm112 family)